MLPFLLILKLMGQAHPCDTLVAPNIVLDSNKGVVGFCHEQKNDAGQPDSGLQFQISLDGVRVGQYQALTPQGPPNSLGSYFFQFPAIQVNNGNHTFTIFSRNISGKEVESVAYPFVVSNVPGPTAAYNLRVIKGN